MPFVRQYHRDCTQPSGEVVTFGTVGGLLLVAVAVLFLVVLYFVLQRNQGRHAADAAALGSWATDHGYTYAERDDQTWTNRWHFAPFGLGTTQHAEHVVSGSYGEQAFAAFDYRYEAEGGVSAAGTRSNMVFHFAVIVVTLPQELPWFDARKRHAHLVPHHDGTEVTVGDKAFDGSFIVHADNQSYALSALAAPLRSMMTDQHLDGIHVVDGRLFAWQGQTHHKVATLPGRLAALTASAAGLPPEPPAS